MMRLSCIGIGSNAIRMLSAEWDGERLCRVLRERRGTRLFAGLRDGWLSDESIRSSTDAVAELAESARQTGAGEVFLFATSAVRDAKNGHVFTDRCYELCGREAEILTGEEEAVYSYLGACCGERAAVIDIGGGSTEITLGTGKEPRTAVSLQMGAVRLCQRQPIMCEADYLSQRQECLCLLEEGASPLVEQAKGSCWTGVGGTMTTLGAMQRSIPLFDGEQCEGMTVTAETVCKWGRKLSSMSMPERRQIRGLMPHRADIMPAGLAILDAAMAFFGMETLRLSQQGNMDGYLKKKFQEMD